MIVRNSLLAMLAAEPAHGYGLKSSFEASTAGVWPLNAGQVYTTLSRLERDGFVEAAEPVEDLPPGPGGEQRSWRITEQGRQTLAEWYESAVDDRSTRDELVIKILVALAAGEADMERVLRIQRTATARRLQEYTRHKRTLRPDSDLAGLLLMDALILRAEAEVRWLDLCEQRLEPRPPRGPGAGSRGGAGGAS